VCILVALKSSFAMASVPEKLRDAKASHPTVVVFGTRDDVNQVFIMVEGKQMRSRKGWLARWIRC